MALHQSTTPPTVDNKIPSTDIDPKKVDPFAFIDIWSLDSIPSKASKLSDNIPFTHFDEVVTHFWKPAFN